MHETRPCYLVVCTQESHLKVQQQRALKTKTTAPLATKHAPAPTVRWTRCTRTGTSPEYRKRLRLGMFALLLTVLNRDYRTPYCNPYEGLLVNGGTSQNETMELHVSFHLNPKPSRTSPEKYDNSIGPVTTCFLSATKPELLQDATTKTSI